MPSDLAVSTIQMPPTIVGGCPSTITVDVVNNGSSPVWGRFQVCLGISTDPEWNAVDVELERTVIIPENDPLIQGAPPTPVTVVFDDVAFPCASQVWVRAVADCRFEVVNNDRSAAELKIGPLYPDLTVPWLWTEIVRVGTQDSAGSITWTPVVCAATTLVVDVAVTNRGCGNAAGSKGEVYMVDAGGNQIVIGAFGVPGLTGGKQHQVLVTGPLPALPPGTPPNFVLRACADVTGAVPVQCDLLHVCSPDVPFFVGGGVGSPIVAVAVDGPVRPGQRPSITWSIQNDCSDLADVAASIEFAGIELYKSQSIVLGLQALAGEQSQTVPRVLPVPVQALANGLFAVGTKPIDLVLAATGPDGNRGPFRAQAPLTVIPEVMTAWWTWSAPAPGAGFAWSSPYTVSGTWTNNGSAAVTPTSLSLREHDRRDGSAASDVIRNFSGSLLALVPGGTIGASWPMIEPLFKWFESASMLPVGPFSVLYDYTIDFFAQDEFSNPYGPLSSSVLTVAVTVDPVKITAASVCFEFQLAAIALAAAGVALLAGWWTGLAAGVMFGLASVAFGIASAARIVAVDPPLPDFSYWERVPIGPEPLPDDLRDLPRDLTPLRTIMELGSRLLAAVTALPAIEGKLIAARIDGDGEAIEVQRSSFEEAVSVVERTNSVLPTSGIEVLRLLEILEIDTEAISRALDEWRRGGMPEGVREQWPLESLPPEAVELINTVPQEWVEPLAEPAAVFERAITALISLAGEAETAARRRLDQVP
jgi:hypothetical protein